jgi:hypothetical protein
MLYHNPKTNGTHISCKLQAKQYFLRLAAYGSKIRQKQICLCLPLAACRLDALPLTATAALW